MSSGEDVKFVDYGTTAEVLVVFLQGHYVSVPAFVGIFSPNDGWMQFLGFNFRFNLYCTSKVHTYPE